MEERAVGPGPTVYVDEAVDVVGSKGSFHPVYADAAATQPWGYFCTACATFDYAMDTMGRPVSLTRRTSWPCCNPRFLIRNSC